MQYINNYIKMRSWVGRPYGNQAVNTTSEVRTCHEST